MSGSIATAGVQAVGPRTTFYAVAALIQLAVAAAVFARVSRRLNALIVVAVTASVIGTVLWRTVGLPSRVPRLRLLDASDAPLTAAGLQVIGLMVLLPRERSSRRIPAVASAAGVAVATLVAVVLAAVGVLSAANEWRARACRAGTPRPSRICASGQIRNRYGSSYL